MSAAPSFFSLDQFFPHVGSAIFFFSFDQFFPHVGSAIFFVIFDSAWLPFLCIYTVIIL
jgi:hypothetical protein